MCIISVFYLVIFFFKQKTAYEVRISDWSSDVCSSDLQCRERIAIPTRINDTLTVLGGNIFGGLTEKMLSKVGEIQYDAAKIAALKTHPKLYQIGRASCRERVCTYV